MAADTGSGETREGEAAVAATVSAGEGVGTGVGPVDAKRVCRVEESRMVWEERRPAAPNLPPERRLPAGEARARGLPLLLRPVPNCLVACRGIDRAGALEMICASPG